MPGKVGRPRKQPQRPAMRDLREDWQVAQGHACGCHGCDDLCPCQNEEAPWRYGLAPKPVTPTREDLELRIRELEGTVRSLELQQQTDRQTIASLIRSQAGTTEPVDPLREESMVLAALKEETR